MKNGQFYSTTKIYGYIKNDTVKEEYKFWLGLLNSKLFWYFIQQTGYVLRGGYFTFKTNYVDPFPIPKNIPKEIGSSVEKLVDEILTIKRKSIKNDVSEQEEKIDEIIFKLYGFSDSEIQSIKESVTGFSPMATATPLST